MVPVQQIAEQTGIIDITNVAPRFGAVWDITGDHKNTFKASAGRFHHSRIAGSDIESVSPAVLGFRLYDSVDLSGDLVYQPGEETLSARRQPSNAGSCRRSIRT